MCANLDGIDHPVVKVIGFDRWLAIEFVGWGLPDLAAAPKVWRDLAESSAVICRDGETHIRKSTTAADLR